MAITHDDLVTALYVSRSILSDSFALETIDMFPFWEDNIGLEVTQEMINRGDNRFQHLGKLYEVVQNTVFQEQFEPGKEGMSAIFVEVSLEEWPEWRQPTGAHDAYDLDAKVTHNSKKWVSNVDNNVWEPGVYGWTEFIE